VLRQGRGPSKTIEFLSFHSNQDPRMMREFRPFFIVLGSLLHAFLHQSAKEFALIRSTGSQTNGVQNCELELSSENTGGQNMLHIFFLLITQDTSCRVLESPLPEPIRSPAPIANSKPKEGLALSRCPRLPEPAPWFKGDGSSKEGLIS
jgi:hypothetical protein